MLVVLVDLPGEVGNIDTGVGFTRDEELVGQVLGELGVPIFKGSERVLRLNHVVGLQVLSSASRRVADASRGLDPEHVHSVVPWVGVGLDVVLTIVDGERTVLLHVSEHGGASGTTVEPNSDR